MLNTGCTPDRRLFTEKKATRIPTHIPSQKALVEAFTKDWHRDCQLSLMDWITGQLGAWTWTITGSRPNVDVKSLKESVDHTLSRDQGWACTEFVGGRNKLHGNKRGTRPWAQYYVCMCPGGRHKPVPRNYYVLIKNNGSPRMNPRFPTCCPINSLELKRQMMRPKPLRLFAKWTTKRKRFGQNHGNVTAVANSWFDAQQTLEGGKPYDSNSGRRALANWLQRTHTPYNEGFEIHGDLHQVWVNYQPNCQKSEFARRTQSRDPHVATAALRRFA